MSCVHRAGDRGISVLCFEFNKSFQLNRSTSQDGHREFDADRKLLLTTKTEVLRPHQGTVISSRFVAHESDTVTRSLADGKTIR